MNSKKSNTNIESVAKNINIRILVILGLMVLVIVAGCIGGEKSEDGVTPIPKNTSEIVVPKETPTISPKETTVPNVSSGTGGMIEKYSLDKLISISDNIVVGEVTEVLKSEWNTQDGNRPVNVDTSNVIYTDIRIKVGEYLKNPLDMTTITVRVLGGVAGQEKLDVEDQPSYSVNENVLVFLKKDDDYRTKDIGVTHFVTAGLIQGKMDVSTDQYVTIGEQKMSLESVKAKIKG